MSEQPTHTNEEYHRLNDSLNDQRLGVLEEKYSIIEDNTVTVSKLTAKVSLLLTIMSFAVVIVSAGAVYTFTGLNNFKDQYASDRLILNTQLFTNQEINTNRIQSSISSLEDKMEENDHQLEASYSELQTSIIKIEAKIDSFHR